MADDARYRVKAILDNVTTGISPNAISKDDDNTYASYITAYSDPQYPLKKVLLGNKKVDAIFSIQPFDSDPLLGWDHKAYGYHERVPIEILTMDKTGITGLKLENKCAQELRRIFEAYCTQSTSSSLRTVSKIRHDVRDMGNWNLISGTYVVDWDRTQGNTTPTYPTVSYGDDWIYEGDRLTGGTEGVWDVTNHKGGSTITFTVNSERNLYLDLTVFAADAYTHNETNLSLSTTTYTTIRWRFKTTGNAKAKIICTDDAAYTQTVLAETASSTWTTGSATLTTAKTLDHVQLYACDGVGTVTYDFVSIDKGNYIFPNVATLEERYVSNDSMMIVPGRMGDLTQPHGTRSAEIHMRCNLDLDLNSSTLCASILTWQRPQTAALDSKSDYNNDDALKELWHYGGSDHLWHWFDLGKPTMQFRARLEELTIRRLGRQTWADMVWREYRHGSASETLTERYGLSL